LLSQLLKNAIEASRHSPTIHILAAQSNEQVVITIKNSDPIPSAVRTQFFDKFVSHGKPNHMGMGSYTAKLLCLVQGGGIDFHTDDELGTEIYVHLPLGK
jgi:K+-sensing histidine kinase KdpD